MKKKGLSPIITTVILVVLVIAIISIIFFWFRGMVEEGVTKFDKNIQLVCDDVDFSVSYDSGYLDIVNNGNVPIYTLNVKITDDGGNYDTEDIKTYSQTAWPTSGLKQGMTAHVPIGEWADRKIEIIPVLIGSSRSGKKIFVCGGQYGETIDV